MFFREIAVCFYYTFFLLIWFLLIDGCSKPINDHFERTRWGKQVLNGRFYYSDVLTRRGLGGEDL